MYLFWLLLYLALSIYILLRLSPKIINYIAKPILNSTANSISISSVSDEEEQVENTETEPTKVEIVNPNDNLDKYDFFVDRKEDKLDTEPKEWNSYIGQAGIKETIRETLIAINKDKTIPYPHILISGSAGYGKSALIHLLALKSNLPLIETVAGNLEKPEDIYKLFSKLRKEPPYSLLFIDEIHGLKKEIGELLLPAVQMFKVANKPIPYFTLAGATTDLGLLSIKLSPLVDRCKQKFILSPYIDEELTKIISNLVKKRNIKITDEALLEIANRSRQTPRLAIGNLDNVFYHAIAKDIENITKEIVISKLEKLGIHKNGITDRDIELLIYLSKQNKPVGQSALTQKLNVDSKTYLYNTEPFMVRKEFIYRTARGRIIAEKGLKLLGEIKNEF